MLTAEDMAHFQDETIEVIAAGVKAAVATMNAAHEIADSSIEAGCSIRDIAAEAATGRIHEMLDQIQRLQREVFETLHLSDPSATATLLEDAVEKLTHAQKVLQHEKAA